MCKGEFTMFFMTEKLKKRVEELEPYRYRDVQEISEFLFQESDGTVPNPKVPEAFDGFSKGTVGMHWSGWDAYLWLHLEADLPDAWKDKKIIGLFDFGNTGGGNNRGFEAMLYRNGKPFQGVDANHKEVFFEKEAAGKRVSLTFRLWSGMEGGGIPMAQEHKIRRAAFAWLDEKVDDLYYLAKMMVETVEQLGEESPERYQLLKSVNDAFLEIDWSYPGSQEFYVSIEKADDLLNTAVDAMEKYTQVTVSGIGHTHIDLAWLWRLKHTREKASRSFSTVMRLMEQFPEYIFLQTQPQIYAYIKEDFPELFAEIKEKVKEGSWEADGGMWVEADCNLPSGESLTRQLLMGSKFVREEFGREMHYLWLPDVFGYSWALPQILKKSGIDIFMTTKISWNEFNRMPHDTFWWKGMDGSEVLTHFVTTPDADSDLNPWFHTYNGMLTPYTVKGVWKEYSDKNLNQEVLISYGFGDGGGGVNRDALEQRRRLDKLPGLPHVKTSTAGAYFKRLQEKIQNAEEYVHTWDGELYLEFHRGTYTSHAYNKKMNRKLEFLYREAEWLTAMAAVKKGQIEMAQQEKLSEGWKIILRHQFHDIIPGSSIAGVYEDSKKEYAIAWDIARNVEETAYNSLLEEQENTWTVLNNAGWTANSLAVVEGAGEGTFFDESGNPLEIQKEGNRTYVQINQIPAMGGRKIFLKKGTRTEEKPSVFTLSKELIETPIYRIRLNEAGQITELYDKEHDRQVLKCGERANVLQIFEDKPRKYDAWNIDIYYQEKMREVTDLVSVKTVESGSLKGVLRFEWIYGKSRIMQDLTVYAKERRIDFVTKVNWQESQQLLKAAFQVDIRATEARYDIQYGNVARPNNWNTSWEMAKFESVAHRWVDLSEHGYGVSLLNDCKYGHDIKENQMRITLLKSAIHPDCHQDIGEHTFTYALLPHKGDFVEGETVKEAYALNQPAKVRKGAFLPAGESFVSFDTEKVELDAVKRSEDGTSLVIRFHEYAGGRKTVTVIPGFSYASWQETNLMEQSVEGSGHTGNVKVEVTPYEIKTLRFLL